MQDLSASIFHNEEWPQRENQELSEDNWLKNGIAMSLFSDQRIEDIPSYEPSKRGYWGDSLDSQAKPLGSRLWCLAKSRLNEESLEDAIQYSYEALSWLLDGNFITDLNIDGKLSKGKILLFIEVTTQKKAYRFSIDPSGGFNGIF
jgi:phage gp46-like protein